MSLSPESSLDNDFFCAEQPSEVTSDHLPPPLPLPLLPHSDEASSIDSLLTSEADHMPKADYLRRCRDRSVDITARLDAVNWILKVHAFYQFSPLTAFLSVNYLDRFLSCCAFPGVNGWPFQLVAVACLSLAVKMEESYVPLLVDLQLFQPKFFFQPKTIQRMEIFVMFNLNWRLRSVTPFHYLHYFFSKLPSSSSHSITAFLSTASDLIISTTRVIDFLKFAPSTVAAAAVLCSAGRDIFSADGQLLFSLHDRVNNEMVRRCQQLMEEYVVDTCSSSSSSVKARITEPLPPPPSPVGVLDAATCGSCDTPSERNVTGSVEEQAEPPNKRLRSSAPDAPQP